MVFHPIQIKHSHISMKDFYGNNISFFEEKNSSTTIREVWNSVRSQEITVQKGVYTVTLKYSVPFNEGTYYARIFAGSKEVASETKVANPYYNLKGTLQGIVEVKENTSIFGDIGCGQNSAVGKQVIFNLTISKIG